MYMLIDRWKAIPVHMGGLYLALCPLGWADAALSQAHRHQTLSLHRLRPQLLPLWPPGTTPKAPRHDVKLFVPIPPQPSPPSLLLRRHARPSGGSKCCWRHLPSLQMWTCVLNMEIYGVARPYWGPLLVRTWLQFSAMLPEATNHPSTGDLHRHLNAWSLAVTWKGLQERQTARSTAITIKENDDWGRYRLLWWLF